MIPRMNNVVALENYILQVTFDDGKTLLYDVKSDIEELPQYSDLIRIKGLFQKFTLDESRTVISWTDAIDLPSDILYEYGQPIL